MSKSNKAALAKGAAAIKKAEAKESKAATVKPSWRDFWKVHPCANAFPLMSPDELQDLADNIDVNGLKVPVERRLTDHGVFLIDGRDRLDALELAGVQLVDDKGGWLHPEYVHSPGEDYTDAQVVREGVGYNIHRRHLTDAQRAEIAAKLANRLVGNPQLVQNAPIGISQAEAAKLMNVSVDQVKRAKAKQDEKPKKPRKRRSEPPAYVPTKDEQARLDVIEKLAGKLANLLTTETIHLVRKLDGKEKDRWLGIVKPLCKAQSLCEALR